MVWDSFIGNFRCGPLGMRHSITNMLGLGAFVAPVSLRLFRRQLSGKSQSNLSFLRSVQGALLHLEETL